MVMNYCNCMQRGPLTLSLLMLLGASCAASDESSSKSTTTTPVPEATPVVAKSYDAAPSKAEATKVVASIASVQLIEDCPDTKADTAAKDVKSKRKAGFAAGLEQPCSQSSLQLAFVGQGAKAAKIELRELRLLSVEGGELALLSARAPTIWGESGYAEWDGILAAETDAKASYKLSVPDFSALEAKLGGTSFGRMYVLEIDLAIGDEVTTLRSPEFERGRKEIIKT